MEWYEIILIIFLVMVAVGVLLGLYLTKYCEPTDDEDYEIDAYFNEKWNKNKPDEEEQDDRTTTESEQHTHALKRPVRKSSSKGGYPGRGRLHLPNQDT